MLGSFTFCGNYVTLFYMLHFLLIYLSFLQFATVIGINHLPLGENIKASDTCFAVAIARAAIAAKGELDLSTRRAGIDIHNACGDIAHSTLHAIDILRINGTGEAKWSVIIDSNRLVK